MVKRVVRRRSLKPLIIPPEDVFKKGSICVLYKGTSMERLVKIIRRSNSGLGAEWLTEPYPGPWHVQKIVPTSALTLLTCEMEILAWASK